MFLFITLAVLAILAVSSILLFRKKNNQKNEEITNKEKVKNLNSWINSYFSDYKLLKEDYISYQRKENFREKWSFLLEELQSIKIKKSDQLFHLYLQFYDNYSKLDSEIAEANKVFIREQNTKYDSLFSNIDGKSLDLQQREVVISEENNTLVLAGAGSGKTLTIAAKVKFLCEVKKILPNEILLISFTNKSADEMTERIHKKMGIPLEATTFHKLGLDIIKKSYGYRPDVFDELNNFVHNYFENEIINHPDLVRNLTEYFTYYLEIPIDLNNCSSLGEAYELEKASDLETLKSKYEREKYINKIGNENSKSHTTLKGEHVKSLEETKIANFLFMHGINYEYERLYPYESEDLLKKAYRPDFYLTDYDIYLEHFGINRNYQCPWLSAIEEKKYVEGIKWKREFHRKNGTKLIETYSYNMSEGNLFKVLEQLLIENGVEFKDRDFIDIFNIIYAKKSDKYFSEFIKLCCSFITLFKSENYKIGQIEVMKQDAMKMLNDFKSERTRLFLVIIENILSEYQKYLCEHNAIDFSDMINDAAEKVRNGCDFLNYKYVVVDEYQDISFSRFNLLKAIIDRTNSKLLCVGDDWQSIYKFAGSDLSLFNDFEKYFGFTNTLKIEKTYRNSQQLIDEASKFVLKNPIQMKKILRSEKKMDYPLVFWGFNDDPTSTVDRMVKKIISEFGVDKSILLLGRTNYDIEVIKKTGLFRITTLGGDVKLQFIASPQTPILFLTVHKAKGVEADNVIIINFKNDKLGFPNQIADDPVLDLVLAKAENFRFAEERRLFYVAITRTKNRAFVLTDNRNPSFFIKEFESSKSVCFISVILKNDENRTICPRCKTGDLLKIEKNGNSFVGCSNFPKCRYTINDASVLISPKHCPNCGGFLVRRKDKNHHAFIGCTNYPECKYTKEINRNR